jgi:hypothetical protein
MKSFDARRAAAFLRFEFLSRRQEFLLPLWVPPVALTLWALMRLSTGRGFDQWPAFPYTAGLLLSIGAALNAHRNEMATLTAPFHLMLPVPASERFAARLVATLLLPLAGQALLLTLLSNVFAAVGAAFGRNTWGLVAPDALEFASTAGTFVTAHAIFFTGGLFYRSHASIKTLLTMAIYAAGLGALALAFAATGVAGAWEELPAILDQGFGVDGVENGLRALGVSWRVAWHGLLPLLLYAAAYHLSVENEGDDGGGGWAGRGPEAT